MGASPNAAGWMRITLVLAGVYNLLWGGAVVIAPNLAFDLFDMARPVYPGIWQCVGMIVGVYGVGYLVAARDPLRHWPIVLVGFLGKIFGPIGFVMAAVKGELPWLFGVTILTNDLIWWIPFGLILWRAASAAQAGSSDMQNETVQSAERMLAQTKTASGETLADLSARTPLLLVFLRHLGCTFCREALADVGARRSEIESRGTRIALVHMSDPEEAREVFARYGLGDVAQVSDPSQALYRSMGLQRGSLWQLFGLKVWWRGFVAGILNRHGVGGLMGDGFQMPGVFLVENGKVVRTFRHESAADRPDYADLSTCPMPS
ncbi:MAG: SelL-related redox protein [Planctomycetota bacterium]|nr:SelL-related redox protein [Planctomycetota bacterium]